MKLKKILTLCCITFLTVCGISCNTKSEEDKTLQQKYGADTDYFIGLKEVQQKNNKAAIRHFNNAIAHGSKYVRRRSLEQKIKLGNIQYQIKEAKNYLQQYNDDAALIFACHIFFDNKEYALLIDTTDSIDISRSPNELVKMRLLAMREKNDSRLTKTIGAWFLTRKITQDHIAFYNDYLLSNADKIQLEVIEPVKDDSESETTAPAENSEFYKTLLLYFVKFRVLCGKGDFPASYDMLENIQEYCTKQKTIPLNEQLTADIGKTYFAVSKRHQQNGEYFLKLSDSEFAKTYPKVKYFSLIYAGRIFSRASMYSKSDKAFTDALECSQTDEEYDMALWFLLNSKLAVSTDKCIPTLEKYCSTWHDPYYFSDFLDNLSLLLFTGAKWESFPKIYKIIDGYADNANTSKFAFLTGELIENKILSGTDAEKITAYQKAFELNAGTDIYYRLLAAKKLNLPAGQIERKIFSSSLAESATNDVEAEILLKGYADFGFEELIYPEWQYFYTIDPKIFSVETICYVAEFLRSCGSYTNNNFYKSLHMISKTANLDNARVNRRVFELAYPKNFSFQIEDSAKEFNVEPYDMLGLIRTESFFNPIVQSHAGAIGLTQLMQTTFDDCVQKLKIKDADITDPATNIRVGTFYYSDLVRRLNNSDILALFAYNAGATRVRRWLQTSRVGLGLYKNLPSDLFLETIPISETRNYGRKVVQGAAVYAWLYYGKSPCEVIDEMM